MPRAAWLIAALLVLVGIGLVSAAGAGARPPLPQCADNLDNDGDGMIDFPFDGGCGSLSDTAELNPATAPVCSDGLDSANSGDGDALADFPNDPGCSSASDGNENNPSTLPHCANTLDDDADGRRDFQAFQAFPRDLGCSWAAETSEVDTQCSDGIDNDGDGMTDFPSDFGCGVGVLSTTPAVNDNSEVDPPQCDDGRDNDGDGNVDFGTDPDCTSASDVLEAGAPPPRPPPPAPPPALCADGLDNDGDGKIDLADPGCSDAADADETDTQVVYVLPQSGNLGAAPLATPLPVTTGASSARLIGTRLLTPFPIVRLRGSVAGKVVRVSLLTVRAPSRSKVSIYCSGRSCPRTRVAINVGRRLVRVRQFERRMRGGTILKIYVTRPGFVGKYTRFRFVSNRVPMRVDRCARTPGTKPRICPTL